jgi:hypothetical protein
VKRAKIVYFSSLGAALGLLALAATLTFGSACSEWPCGFVRFVVLIAAAGSALGAWGTAVMIASVYKVAWPLLLTVTMVVLAATAFAAASHAMAVG